MSEKKTILIKKLMYQSSYRGCKEMELILKNFSSEFLEQLSIEDLIYYQQILDIDDVELMNFIYNKKNIKDISPNNTILIKLYEFIHKRKY